MSEKQECNYIPKEVGFEQKINDRMEIWLALVEDSDLDAKTKDLLKNRLTMLKEHKKHHWEISDAIYNTVVNIDNVIRGKSREAEALFENLRGDLWDFYEEI